MGKRFAVVRFLLNTEFRQTMTKFSSGTDEKKSEKLAKPVDII